MTSPTDATTHAGYAQSLTGLRDAGLLALAITAVASFTTPQGASAQASLESCARSVVRVEVGERHGSGTIIDSRGYILTNHHVVSPALEERLTAGDALPAPPLVDVRYTESVRARAAEPVKAQVVRVDTEHDLALLRVLPDANAAYERPPRLPVMRIATDAELALGRAVHAVGYPLHFEAITVTSGTITGLQPDDDGELDWITTDADFNPGNSGGALVTANCHLLGVPTQIYGGMRVAAIVNRARPITPAVRTWLRESMRPLPAAGAAPREAERASFEAVEDACDAEAEPQYGALVGGSRVRLARHRAVRGEANWSRTMGPFVGREARVVGRAGRDEGGCATVVVDVDRGLHRWRVRDLVPVAVADVPRGCGEDEATTTLGPIQVGAVVRLGEHEDVDGERNWADSMAGFVGQTTEIRAIAGFDHSGCPIVRVNADRGRHVWRVRALEVLEVNETAVDLELEPGFVGDPVLFEGEVAGAADASDRSSRCRGFVTARPHLVFRVREGFSFLRIVAHSEADVMLMLQDPSGDFICTDSGDGDQPRLEGAAIGGLYRVWVGHVDEEIEEGAAFRLAITERRSVRASVVARLPESQVRARIAREGSSVSATADSEATAEGSDAREVAAP